MRNRNICSPAVFIFIFLLPLACVLSSGCGKKETEKVLNITVSNENPKMGEKASFDISIDNKPLTSVDVGVSDPPRSLVRKLKPGSHTVSISERKSQAGKSELINLDKDLWLIASFKIDESQPTIPFFDIKVIDKPPGY